MTIWRGEHLEVDEYARLDLLEIILIEERGRMPPNLVRLTVPRVVEAMKDLTDKQQQVIIRLADLAYRGEESYEAISKEMGTKVKSVRQLAHWALMNLWHNLNNLKLSEQQIELVPALVEIMEEANRRMQ